MEKMCLEINSFYDNIIRQAIVARERFVSGINKTIDTCEGLRKSALTTYHVDRESWLLERGKTDFNYNYEINLMHRDESKRVEESFKFLMEMEKELTDGIIFYREKSDKKDDEKDENDDESGSDNDTNSVLSECSEGYEDITDYFDKNDTDVKHIGKGKKLAILLNESYPFATDNQIDDLYRDDAYLKDLIKKCNGVGYVRPVKIETSVHYNFGRQDEPEPGINVGSSFLYI